MSLTPHHSRRLRMGSDRFDAAGLDGWDGHHCSPAAADGGVSGLWISRLCRHRRSRRVRGAASSCPRGMRHKTARTVRSYRSHRIASARGALQSTQWDLACSLALRCRACSSPPILAGTWPRKRGRCHPYWDAPINGLHQIATLRAFAALVRLRPSTGDARDE